ncbi:MAG: DUF6316 family protein [Gammaproteobacteria bacterium]|nr:DUF6316 family protein [Gammaproteobacteria bacterium]
MRKDDVTQSTRFRSAERVFCMNGKWFFQTREQDHGPYPSQGAAETELKRYVSEMDFFSEVKRADEPAPESPDWQLTDFDEKEQRS